MQKQNFQEYKALREEIASIKKCITDYMGFLLMGSGAAFSAWGGMKVLATKESFNLPIGYSSLALSLIVVFMLSLLIYKFISHNRYVGYCSLLGQEKWSRECNEKVSEDLMLWEVCLARLRIKDIEDKVTISDELKAVTGINNAVKTYTQESTFWISIYFLIKTILKMQTTVSWGFPVTIVRIFLVILWSYVVFGIYLLWPIINNGLVSQDTEGLIAITISVVVLFIHIILWINISCRFHSIMMGEAAVMSFSIRFKKIRKEILKDVYDVEAEWFFPKNSKQKHNKTT